MTSEQLFFLIELSYEVIVMPEIKEKLIYLQDEFENIIYSLPEEEQHQILDTNATPEDRKLSFIKDGYTTLHEIITAINNNK